MATAELVETTELPKNFTDVLYLTNQKQMPSEIKRLLKQKKLTSLILSIDQFPQILHRLGLVGTVIIDAKDLDALQQQKLGRIIESLEMKNIGTILLNNRVKLPVKSFSLAGPQVKSFSMTTTMESVSIDELWVRMSVNLAYRQKGSEIFVKPTPPPRQMQITHNNLAEQLIATGALVDNLSEQLRVAGLVQRDFLPAQLPNCKEVRWGTVFLPAEWVSGDIYDVVRIDEQHIGFYVADAIGHSMPAALLTIFLKQAMVMRETIENNYRIIPPSEIMTNLNKRMTGQKLSGYQFATCCYCLLNIKTLQLTYARAGHPYPILTRPQEPPQQLEIKGSLLGIFEHPEYIQQTVQLQQGDKLMLYSDGAEPLIGSFNDLGGFNFSEEFYEIKDLPIAEMMDKLNALVPNKRSNSFEVDDVTAVGFEIL